jgi:hypothetical protein
MSCPYSSSEYLRLSTTPLGIKRRKSMGNAFLLKKKVLCDKCYWEEIEYLTGREEIAPRRMVNAKECDKCHAELDPEEDL